METQSWNMTHTLSLSIEAHWERVHWWVCGEWFLVSLHFSFNSQSFKFLFAPGCFLLISPFFPPSLSFIGENNSWCQMSSTIHYFLSLWVAIVFVCLLPFHRFLLWRLQLQLKKKAFNSQLLWACTIGKWTLCWTTSRDVNFSHSLFHSERIPFLFRRTPSNPNLRKQKTLVCMCRQNNINHATWWLKFRFKHRE